MTKLCKLNTRMFELEKSGNVSEEEYATYKWLLGWLEFTSAYVGDRLPIGEARKLRKQLEQDGESK